MQLTPSLRQCLSAAGFNDTRAYDFCHLTRRAQPGPQTLRCIPPPLFGKNRGGYASVFSLLTRWFPLWTVDVCNSLLNGTPRESDRRGKFEESCFGHPCATEPLELCGPRACATNRSVLARVRVCQCEPPMFCNTSQMYRRLRRCLWHTPFYLKLHTMFI
jgi:hypothetical protein